MPKQPTWQQLQRELTLIRQGVATLPQLRTAREARADAQRACAEGTASLAQVELIRPGWVNEYRVLLDEWAAFAALLARAPWDFDYADLSRVGVHCAPTMLLGGFPPEAELPRRLKSALELYYEMAPGNLTDYRWVAEHVWYPKLPPERVMAAYCRDVSIAALLGESGLRYRRQIWTQHDGQWLLRPDIAAAGHQVTHDRYYIDNFAGFRGVDLLAAIQDGRLVGRIRESQGGVHKYLCFTNADIVAAITQHGWTLGVAN